MFLFSRAGYPAIALALTLFAACERTPDARPFELVHSWELPDAISALDIRADGEAVLLGSALGESSLWNAPWNLSVPFDRASEGLIAASFTTDGHLFFLRARGAVEVRADNGALTLDPHMRLQRLGERAVASPSGRFIAYDAQVYDFEAMRLVAKSEVSDDQRGLAFAGERAVLVTRAGKPQLTVLRLDGHETIERSSPEDATAGAITSDAGRTAAGTARGIYVWNSERAEPVCQRSTKDPVTALRFSGSARWLAAVSGARLLVLDAASCELMGSVLLVAQATRLDVDGDLIAVADAGANLYVWDVFNHRLIGRAKVFDANLVQMRLHAASKSVLAAANSDKGAVVKLLRAAGP
jgi:hypothetical protein